MDDEILKPRPDPTVAIVGAIALGIGFGIGYLLGKRQQKFIHAVPAQDWDMSDLAVVSDTEEETDTDIPDEFSEVIEKGKTFIEQTLGEPVEPEHRTIFDTDSDGTVWNWEDETSKRTEEAPYILHQDEFITDEREYRQSNLTYYAGDDILVDEDNVPIYNPGVILGPLLFGHGSKDPNVVYIRNSKLLAEYEVIRDPGHYSVEVLGNEIEEQASTTDLKHSSDRKFRER